jgi:class 3 adenylate cyclase/YHS domain-containing protein
MVTTQNLAILMADLSGYTAMTEMHGVQTALDVVSRYLSIGRQSLYGSARLLERVGDQLVFISQNPYDIARTAIQLISYCQKEEHFLQVHAGIHYGTIIEQDGSCYGPAINCTARVASRAKAGKISCTEDFIRQLEGCSEFTFTTPRPVVFKNIWKPVITADLEINQEASLQVFTDPVCRMQVGSGSLFLYNKNGEVVHFCSEECSHVFASEQHWN